MLDYTVLYAFLMKTTALVVVSVSTVETGNVCTSSVAADHRSDKHQASHTVETGCFHRRNGYLQPFMRLRNRLHDL